MCLCAFQGSFVELSVVNACTSNDIDLYEISLSTGDHGVKCFESWITYYLDFYLRI